MATVYLADDVKHHRRVAVKVLRPELASALGPERFLREIETTANLRHPHILPLFDSGAVIVQGSGPNVEGGAAKTMDLGPSTQLFYVMPYVEGESLQDRLNREKQLPLDEALRIAREVADALHYAHGRGVLHRDIKPANILLEAGHAVVADFGIARAVDVAGGDRLTETGVALGTPLYMSPEQAAGEKSLDSRSDQYALGCVLYEMLAGQPPFTGPTAQSVTRQHLTADPPQVRQLRPTVPEEVGIALQRALAKAPADRFADVAQFADSLGPGNPALTRSGPTAAVAPRRRYAVAAALGLVACLAVGFVLLNARTARPLQIGRRTQVTLDPGLEIDPALSPDGKFLAYSGPRGELEVRQVEGGVPIPVVKNGDGDGRWPAWLPDGQRLVFVSPRGVELVSALGGVPRLLMPSTRTIRGVAVSPDGRTLAFGVNDTLYALPLDGGAFRVITAGRELHSPAWSPDGRWIAFVSGNLQYVSSGDLGNDAPSSIHVVRAAGGDALRVTEAGSLNVSPAWASGRLLLYVSNHDGGRDIYQVRLERSGAPAGESLRITTGLNPLSVALSRDGGRLAYAAFTETSNAWSVPIPTGGAVSVSSARPITIGNQILENLGVSADGRWLAFGSNRGGSSQLYKVRLDSADALPQQLTFDTMPSYWAAWSPDGREIAFHRFRGERRQVAVIPAEGGTPVAVTDGSEDERAPEWSPDGRTLLTLTNWGTRPALHLITRGADGHWSAPRPIHVVIGKDTMPSSLAAWSPDGRFLACACGTGGLVIAPVPEGQAHRLLSPYSSAWWAFPQWSADGKTVFHITEDSGRVSAVIAVPVDGRAPRVVLRFDNPTRPWHRFGFRVGAGKMFFTLGDRQSDIWVAQVERR
jgi:serine/threonine-protein kinase